MLVNIHHDSKREHATLLVAGVVFVSLIATLIWLSIAISDKKFTQSTMVTIQADRAGLQLERYGDVRLNGALVGQVRSVSQDGEQAIIEVALKPEVADKIPANVGVQIIPTTLFGQKFVSFVRPADPQGSLEDGDVIPADRVETNVELSKILADLFPLLRAVQPAELNYTLNALATALEGRGDQLGETLDELDAYLGAISDKLPTLRQDLISLANVADIYDLAAPDLIEVLGNLTVTSKTIIEKAGDLDSFFSDLQGLADTSTRVLSDNRKNLIRVGRLTEPVLKLLAVYSPEFPCLIEGAAKYAPRLAQTFAGNQVKQYIEFGTAQYEAYHADDRPLYGEVGHGPWCDGLPNPKVPADPAAFAEGSDIDENPPTGDVPTILSGGAQRSSQTGLGTGPTSGYAGTDADKAIVNALLSGETGRAADSDAALGSLLYGPVVRGGEGP